MNADEISIREKENNIEILNKEKIYLINKIKELKEEISDLKLDIENNQSAIINLNKETIKFILSSLTSLLLSLIFGFGFALVIKSAINFIGITCVMNLIITGICMATTTILSIYNFVVNNKEFKNQKNDYVTMLKKEIEEEEQEIVDKIGKFNVTKKEYEKLIKQLDVLKITIKILKEEMYIQNNQVIIENTIETNKTEILKRIRIK